MKDIAISIDAQQRFAFYIFTTKHDRPLQAASAAEPEWARLFLRSRMAFYTHLYLLYYFGTLSQLTFVQFR